MFELTVARGRTKRVGAIGSLTALLLLSACDGWKLGWPDNIAGSSGSGSGSGFGVAFAQTGVQYLAAFNCGSNQDFGFMVNIYNPSGRTETVTRRVTVSIPSGLLQSDAITNRVDMDIGTLRAMEVDCNTIRFDLVSAASSAASSSFISGVLILESGMPVEVIATYTAGSSIDVERIQAR